jgi:hypothetical protein
LVHPARAHPLGLKCQRNLLNSILASKRAHHH